MYYCVVKKGKEREGKVKRECELEKGEDGRNEGIRKKAKRVVMRLTVFRALIVALVDSVI